MRESINPIIKRVEVIETTVTELRKSIETNENNYTALKNVIIHQQRAIDGFHEDNRESNLIISGVLYEDGENVIGKLNIITSKIGLENTEIVNAFRIGKKKDGNEEDYRQIMVKLKSKEEKFIILRVAKSLKGWEEEKDDILGKRQIYINHDESPLTRKENYRLRQERN